MTGRKKYKTVDGLECPQCLQRIWSRHRHDMRHCFCGYCFIDGGRDYFRYGYGGPLWEIPWPSPLPVKIKIEVSE